MTGEKISNATPQNTEENRQIITNTRILQNRRISKACMSDLLQGKNSGRSVQAVEDFRTDEPQPLIFATSQDPQRHQRREGVVVDVLWKRRENALFSSSPLTKGRPYQCG